MKDCRIEKLAKNLIEHSINLQKNENILIEMLGESTILLGKELIKQAEKIGARPFLTLLTTKF